MRVLMQARSDLLENIGGDTIQVLKTKEGIERAGLAVDLSLQIEPNLDEYDIVHLFNACHPQTYRQFNNAQKQNKKIAVSTVYWNMSENSLIWELKKHRFGRMVYDSATSMLKSESLQQLIDYLAGYYAKKKMLDDLSMGFEVLRGADILLPNSKAEMDIVEKDFAVKNKYILVPNAVDTEIDLVNEKLFVDNYGLKDFVLCVGRVETRKNQDGLIRAMREIDVPLVIIGSQKRVDYYKYCTRLVHKKQKVIFIDEIGQEMLYSAYAAARVHVLPSWYDTPGLASLEAGLFGCNLVVSIKGSTRDYFGDLVEYCNPLEDSSITAAITAALIKKKDSRLKEHIISNFTWDRAASKTLEAYRAIYANQDNKIGVM